jgi:predicted secreted Zn-dependent protease
MYFRHDRAAMGSAALMKYFTILAAIAALAYSGAAGAQGVAVSEDTVFYNVTGDTAAEIFADIERRGPGFANGHYDAAGLTEWRYGYSIRMQSVSGGCETLGPEVTLDLKFHIPNWVNLGSPSQSVRQWWDDLIRHVWRHERRHAEIARRGAEHILTALRRAPIAANCKALEADLKRRMQRVVEESVQPAQEEFDRSDRLVVRLDAR